MDMIKFQEKEYAIREVELPNIGNVLISLASLNDLLLDDNGSYVSDEAIFIDESIYYFVDKSDIELSDEDLIKKIIYEIND